MKQTQNLSSNYRIILHSITLFCFVLPLIVFLPCVIFAEWANHPIGTKFTEDERSIEKYQVHSDQNGGAWISFYRNWRTRVQHVDSDGNMLSWPDAINVLPDSIDTGSEIMGTVPTSDGGILAAYGGYWDGCPDGRCHVRVQKISLDGEKLWGPFGVYVYHDADRNIFPTFNSVCSDSADGIWMFFLAQGTSNLLVSGVNADGSLKTENPVNLGQIESIGTVVIGPDNNGGVYITHITDNHQWETEYNHLYSDLSLQHEEFVTIHAPSSNTQRFILPEANNGFYYACGGLGHAGAVLLNIASNGSINWDPDIIIRPGGTTYYISPPVLMSDNDIAILVQGSGYNPSVMVRLNEDGTPHYQNEFFNVDSTFVPDTSGVIFQGADEPSLVRIPENDHLYYFGYLYQTIQNAMSKQEIRAHLLDTDGNDLWAGDSIMVTDGHTEIHGRRNSCAGVLATDNSVFLICGSWNYDTGYITAHVNRILPDGTVCGRINDVEEYSDNSIPKEFELLSTYPNPFNSTVNFRFKLDKPRTITYQIYNLQGQEVASKMTPLSAGEHTLSWQAPSNLAAGVYITKWQVNRNTCEIGKLVLLK